MREGGNILTLLGLCLRGRNLAVGDAAADAADSLRARLLLLASDAAPRTRRRAEALSRQGQCLLETLPFTREEVGHALGRSSAALCAVTDTGLAAALMRRLEGQYPGQYRQSLERLELKGRRAAERRERGPKESASRRKGRTAGGAVSAQAAPPGRKAPPARRGKPGRSLPPPSGPGEAPRRREKQESVPGNARRVGAETARREGAAPPRVGKRGAGRTGEYAHSRPVKKGRGSFPGRGR